MNDQKARSVLLLALGRLSRPATWAGLGSILVAFGWTVEAGTLMTIIQIGTGVAGALAIVLRE